MTLRAWLAFLVALGGIAFMASPYIDVPAWALGIFIGFALRCMYELGRQSKEKEER